MNRNINQKISEVLRQDDFSQIIEYFLHICKLIEVDFYKKGRKLPNNENQIRTIFLEEYLANDTMRKIYNMQDYDFTPEIQEHYIGNGNYLGRADIRIKLKTDFEKSSAYYLVECKRIDGSINLNTKYVEEGVARFVTQKYSSYYGKNIMLGFVISKINVSQNTYQIQHIQNLNEDVHMHGTLELLSRTKYYEVYKCKHQLYKGELELRHIFADFSNITA